MKNFEKYKTTKERVDAFRKFCKPVVWNCAKVCKVGNANELGGVDPMECSSNWLDLEADELKPMPCPFCGKDCSFSICRGDNCGVVACNYCGYRSSHTATVEGAIMNHNRVCKAVAAFKENN